MVSGEVDSGIRRVVIPAAGLGTRLLPATKEMPKEMLPVFASDIRSNVCVKPLLQVIFEQLYDVGFREFNFIVGREKESISNHFTSDLSFLKSLSENGKDGLVEELLSFYKKVNSSSLVFINQPEPSGFGDAVLRAKPYVKEQFLVQAGDILILSKGNKHLRRLLKIHEELGSVATFMVKDVEDPRPFGIIEGDEMESGVYDVEKVFEKPEEPPTNLAITALYLFSPDIFEALKATPRGVGGEYQLTDAIQRLIDCGLKVTAVKLDDSEFWLDIGSPEAYWDVLTRSYDFSQRQRIELSRM